jgi:Pyruvate/2-oxoacid:ferredoxin oxidoreductase gamma subunit
MSADLMRRYLAIVEGSSHEIDSLFREPLSESVVLTEGAVADRIKAAMAKVSQKFGRPAPQVLDQVAGRADSLYSGVPAVKAVVDRAKALGRSPALLMAMVGICGALIGMSPNPTAAQDAATKLQPILALQDVNQIADLLAQHGIKAEFAPDAAFSLPRGLTPAQVQAAHALKAIAEAQFTGRTLQKSEREMTNRIAIEGGIQREGSSFNETISLWTADHELLIAEYTTSFQVENGFPALINESSVGLQVELASVFQGLSETDQVAVSNYINQNTAMQESAGAASMQSVVKMLKAKGPALCLFVAGLAVRGGRVVAKIRISSKGVQVGGAA